MGKLDNNAGADGNHGPTRFPGATVRHSGTVEGPKDHDGTGDLPPEAAPCGGWLSGVEAEFHATAEALRAELAPAGPIEGLLMDRLIQAAWRLRRAAQAEAAGAFDEALLRHEAAAERSFFRSLRALERRQDRRGARGVPADPISMEPDRDAAGASAEDDRRGASCLAAPMAEEPDDDPESWFGRLGFDPNISEETPVVRGTWITVNHVISLIVDGWTWTDILRSHPELNEEDIRACLAYHVQEDRGDLRPLN